MTDLIARLEAAEELHWEILQAGAMAAWDKAQDGAKEKKPWSALSLPTRMLMLDYQRASWSAMAVALRARAAAKGE